MLCTHSYIVIIVISDNSYISSQFVLKQKKTIILLTTPLVQAERTLKVF